MGMVIAARDFNALLGIDEKVGGLQKPSKVEDFRDFVSNCKLVDIIPKIGKFTWTNKRLKFANISERLDRFLFLKNKIKDWNKVSFKNAFVEKSRIEDELEEIGNRVMQFGMTNVELELEKKLKSQYMEILKREELYWKDKARELWIAEGDLNTKFFHASYKARRINNKIFSIKDEKGILKIEANNIELIALKYYMDILGGTEHESDLIPMIEEVINPLISSSDCDMLLGPYSLEEIKHATFTLHPKKAPEPDGIMTDLLKKCRDFMGKDIWNVIEEFRKKHKFVKEINHTIITPFPKKQVEEYLPSELEDAPEENDEHAVKDSDDSVDSKIRWEMAWQDVWLEERECLKVFGENAWEVF
ncbi:uncharacterized protein LOC131064437 [Cryptomeria japonica]|uniref:uncharacterized protein LOC131064437 n=1 Tax=Cryptomeria japonica TaxID=3369 RepID=UPI0027DA6C98|nr:uncharacterized protein LOC131064437 [Cryptomeria japonica]